MKNLKVFLTILSAMLFFGMYLTSCSKMDDQPEPVNSMKLAMQNLSETAVDSVFLQDTMQRTFTIFDACGTNIGTITSNSWDLQIIYESQTTTTITLYGNGSSKTFTKGVVYYFKPNNCANKTLRVTFATGIQTVCSTFSITGCNWSFSSGGCSTISSWSVVSTINIC